MAMPLLFLCCVFVLGRQVFGDPVTFENGVYNGLTISVDPSVPEDQCKDILTNLEVGLTSGSRAVYESVGGKASWGTVVILLPSQWPDSCIPVAGLEPQASQGEQPDIRIGLSHPVYYDAVWTQQSRGCGEPGDFIYISEKLLRNPFDIGRMLAREWAKYRYGVFDEVGYAGDLVYPSCYYSDLTEDIQVNGCSDRSIRNPGVCESGQPINITQVVNPEASSSLMFASESEHVTKFCDKATHDRFSPTKQNSLCGTRSVMEVINSHRDFNTSSVADSGSGIPINTTPTIQYKRQMLTRYVVVIEDTKDMLVRRAKSYESWSFLRLAIRKWAVHDLPSNSEVGIVSANEGGATQIHKLSPLQRPEARDLVASNIPYTPGDSHAPACLSCGLNEAFQMLEERALRRGPASSVIIVVAPGTLDFNPEVVELTGKLAAAKVRVATITYPAQLRQQPLDWLAQRTHGVAYTVAESRYNMATSFLSTYFRLTNVFWSLVDKFYQGDQNDLRIEIHRRELLDNGRSSVTGNFVLEPNLGEPAQFTILTHNIENPLIRGISLISPSHQVYSTRSDSLLSLKLLSLPARINETGSWTYTIERFPGSPQPHYVQVMATPFNRTAAIVRARLWTSRTVNPLVLYTEVKRGDYPVLSARVEVTVMRPGTNGSSVHRERFELIDSGSGDPDLMKGDGIYSRYFSPAVGGPGVYTFEVTVTDNGNTAYTWRYDQQQFDSKPLDIAPNCCGSYVPIPSVEPLQPFQRVLPPVTIMFTSDHIATLQNVGKIGDLKVEVFPGELKARLSWTAPDMGGASVARYELKYATSIGEILDNFDTATTWSHGAPFPLAPGSETTFTLELTKNPSLLDQTLYIAVRGFKDLSTDSAPGPISNWVRLLIPSPPPPPPPPSSTYPYSQTDLPWPPQDESVIPKIAEKLEFNLDLILPLIIGVFVLAICLAIYCYFCVIRRRKPEKTQPGSSKHPEKPLNVSIVPTTQNSNGNLSISSPILNSSSRQEITTNTVPQFEPCLIDEEPKKRFSVAQYNDGQMTLPRENTATNLSIISGNPNPQNGTLVRGRTLSPYQSWTASQLLHEHERRHSPYGQVGDEYMHPHDQYAPPVPPLPAYSQQQSPQQQQPPPEAVYGSHQQTVPPPGPFINGYHRNNMLLFNPSLQGSLSSVSSGDRKKRNVTMV
ncbi:calcium-activated chloride channel regulator 1 isoform X2 [Nilaparvata lugens]|uniref:calcium-activated chloride channel regulator 1 isoform X2 n=1 Tax=Nilaparvata lugens TaxID=108931 RepID=UPI00193D481B|nr:calcium-activated chloride channel regulator 1 isoform X2 [Nilaparvata lugens]